MESAKIDNESRKQRNGRSQRNSLDVNEEHERTERQRNNECKEYSPKISLYDSDGITKLESGDTGGEGSK